MKLYFLTLFSLLQGSILFAQDFESQKPGQLDFVYDKNKIDSNAHAVVLQEFGTSRLQIDDATGSMRLYFDYHVKIKIFDKDGFSSGNVVVPLRKSDGRDREELAMNIQGFTYNVSENGKFTTTPIDKKAIFYENRSKYLTLLKFTLPNLQPGSVIEYSYSMSSPFLFNFKEWHFQDVIPKVKSEYVAFIPATHNYNVSLRGFYKLTNQKSEVSRECLRLNGHPIDCSKMTYTMENVPAFIEESYMTAASNFLSAMYFELSDVQYANGQRQTFTKTWKDVDYELATDKSFGLQMKRKDVFKDIIPVITKDASDNLAKAKAVYNYIKKQVRWNNYLGMFCESSVKEVIEKRSGNIGDINLSLIAALNAAGIPADAVALSTRENGTINKLFPVISDFNYVVATTTIDGTNYLLDATDPLLPFGMLPLRCINDQGRVISINKTPSYWVDMVAKQRKTSFYNLNGELGTNGKIVGALSISHLGYDAYSKRIEIGKSTSIDEYVEKLDERLTSVKIKKYDIENMDDLELPLIEKFEVEITVNDQNGGDQIFLTPFLINPISKNPFNLNDRIYPVDFGSLNDERSVITLKLPASYRLVDKPKDLSMGLPENGGRYILKTEADDNTLNVTQLLQFNKPIFQSNEYLSLKEFYSRIIQNQKTDVVLKKN